MPTGLAHVIHETVLMPKRLIALWVNLWIKVFNKDVPGIPPTNHYNNLIIIFFSRRKCGKRRSIVRYKTEHDESLAKGLGTGSVKRVWQ